MRAFQIIFCVLVMVENRACPRTGHMTVLTFFTKQFLVRVFLLMARDAIVFDILEHVTFVTCLTGHGYVPSTQGILRIVIVIKLDLGPEEFVMAAFAFVTVISRMHVI